MKAPFLSIDDHDGTGYTIQFRDTDIKGSGRSLDQAWKAYKNAVLDANAAEARKFQGKQDPVGGKKLRARRRLKKTQKLREQAEA